MKIIGKEAIDNAGLEELSEWIPMLRELGDCPNLIVYACLKRDKLLRLESAGGCRLKAESY